MYLTGVAPMNQFAEEIAGAAPTQKEKAKACATKCAGGGAGVQPCGTTLLHTRLGEKADPDIAAPWRQLRLWMSLLETWPKEEFAKLTQIWRQTAKRCEKEGQKVWSKTAGPLTATIMTLQDLEWEPSLPNSWLDKRNQLRADIAEHAWSNTQILQHVWGQLRDATWRKAAAHFLGAGLEKGAP